MFTGIVQAACVVRRVDERPGLRSFGIALTPALARDLAIGASVAIDGVCLTVTGQQGDVALFDVMQQTLQVTTLGAVQPGQRVNVERSARYGDEIGGHVVSGHIDAAVPVVDVAASENNREVTYRAPAALLPYILPRGFIALNGCSLTVAAVDRAAATFKVCFIPETLRATTHGDKGAGDRVNLELDRQTQAIVDTVRAYLADADHLAAAAAPG